jgi:hypothetical protein
MRKIFMFAAILCSVTAFGKPVSLTTVPGFPAIASPGSSPKEIKSLKVKDIQKIIGRKLTLKEKIVFLLLKKKLKYQEGETKQGQTAFIIAIFGLIFLIAGLFLPYFLLGALAASIIAIVMGTMAKKKDSSDTKAKAATLMGWITLGGLAFLLLLVAIIIASWSWNW